MHALDACWVANAHTPKDPSRWEASVGLRNELYAKCAKNLEAMNRDTYLLGSQDRAVYEKYSVDPRTRYVKGHIDEIRWPL